MKNTFKLVFNYETEDIKKTNIVAVVVFKKNIVIKIDLAGLIFLCYFKKH